jgi:hypothetical protein
MPATAALQATCLNDAYRSMSVKMVDFSAWMQAEDGEEVYLVASSIPHFLQNVLGQVFIDLRMPARAGTLQCVGCDTNHAARHALRERILARPDGGPDLAASSKRQFCDSAHARHRAACQIVKKVFEVISKIFQVLALREVIGEFFEVPEPVIAVLPINVASTHAFSVKHLDRC